MSPVGIRHDAWAIQICCECWLFSTFPFLAEICMYLQENDLNLRNPLNVEWIGCIHLVCNRDWRFTTTVLLLWRIQLRILFGCGFRLVLQIGHSSRIVRTIAVATFKIASWCANMVAMNGGCEFVLFLWANAKSSVFVRSPEATIARQVNYAMWQRRLQSIFSPPIRFQIVIFNPCCFWRTLWRRAERICWSS